MKQSSSQHPLHVAIIMDGNGRWAAARGWPRLAGHRAGAEAVRRTVEAGPKLGIGTLTLYAFSSDNWQRPREEVSGLFRLLRQHLRTETKKCVEHGIRVNVIGRRDRLPVHLVAAIDDVRAAAPLVAALMGLDGESRYGALALTPPQRRNQTLAVLAEAHNRRRGTRAFLVHDHDGLTVFHDRDHRVRGAQVDTDHSSLTHLLALLRTKFSLGRL